nr:peptidoglycan recognition family protein [Oscillochloris trichoides]
MNPTQAMRPFCVAGACGFAPYGEGFYDPVTNPSGYACYTDLLPGRSLDDILDTIVIHHEGNDQTYNVREVQRKHMLGNGWTDIGYHYAIDPKGVIYEGRDIGVRGSHVEGQNTGKIGVLLLGDFQPGPEVSIGGIVIWRDTDDPRPTQQQVTMATALIRWLDVKYGIESVGAHRDYVATECPGDNAMPFIPSFNAAAQQNT